MESTAHQVHSLGSRVNNMMVYTSTSAVTGEFAGNYYHQSLLKLSSLKMNNFECKPGRGKSSSVVIRAGLLDMLGVSSPQKGNFLQTGKEFAINSFNKGAAMLPKKGEVAYKALMAAMASFVEPKKDSAGLSTIGTHSWSVPILTPEVMATPKVGLMQPVDPFRQGRMLERGKVYRQTFVIRSYEVGADRTASIDTLTNLFQVSYRTWTLRFPPGTIHDFLNNNIELFFNSTGILVASWLFCIQHFPGSVSFPYFIEDQTHFSKPGMSKWVWTSMNLYRI